MSYNPASAVVVEPPRVPGRRRLGVARLRRLNLISPASVRMSLRMRMIALIVLPTLAIYIAILGFAMLRLRQDVQGDVEAEMTKLASGYAARFDGAFREAAAIATATAHFMEIAGDLTEEQIFAQLTSNTQQNPSIYGAAMAFDPVVLGTGEQRYCPYVYREGSDIRQMFISREVYDWYSDPQWQWWHRPATTGQGAWSDPYFDEGAGNVLMVTFSAPFFAGDRLRGVTTVDIMLPTLREQIGGDIDHELDVFILTQSGQFVFSPDVDDIMTRTVFDIAREVSQPQLAHVGEMITAGIAGAAAVDGWGVHGRSLVFYAPIESTGWSFVARVPQAQALARVRERMTSAVMALAGALSLIVACIWFVSGRITRPIVGLRSKVLEIANGDLEARVDGIDRNDEIGELAASFNHMTEELRAQIIRLADERVVREKIERDLDLARDIQHGLLPRTVPDLPDFELAGWNQAADKTGGDFFDWMQLPDGRTVVTLADVTGHGIGPALIVAVCRAYLRASTSTDSVDLCAALNRVNDLLCSDIPSGRFVTAVLGLIDPDEQRMSLVSAGHGPILFYEAAIQQVHLWKADVLPLGVVSDLGCERAREFDFAPGDMLILVTDGFFEWLDNNGQQYGIHRLIHFTRNHTHLPPTEFIQLLHDDVLHFAQGTMQADDLTALIIRRKG